MKSRRLMAKMAPPSSCLRGRLPYGGLYAGTCTHRTMTTRITIEETTTHTMSEAHPCLPSAACSLIVGLLGLDSRTLGPATERMGRSLDHTLIVLN
jgi:hypothetical protein